MGEVNDGQKAAFLGNACALLFPIDWPEPFGLVMAEALACGTPVIARRRGSVPEVVRDGVTGHIGETDDELVELCQHIHRISRGACRDDAVRRFSPQTMVDGYEAIYRHVLESAPADAPSPDRLSQLLGGHSGTPLDNPVAKAALIGIAAIAAQRIWGSR